MKKGKFKIIGLIIFILIVVFFITTYAVSVLKKPEINDEARKDVAGKFIQLSKGTVHYELSGPENGEIVVMIHGFTTPYFVWDNNVEAVKKAGFRILRYDHYGRGFSDRPNVKYNRDLYDQLLVELLQKLNIKTPVHIVGLSMGGAITMIFADRHSELVSSISLIAPAGFPIYEPFLVKLAQAPIIGDYIMNVLGDSLIIIGQRKAFVHPEKHPEYEEQFKAQMKYRGFNRSLLSTLRYMDMDHLSDVYDRIGKLNKPALLIWGNNDQILPFSNSEKVQSAIPHIEFHEIDGAGHNVNYENPDVVNSILLDFLKNN
jgi:pimeloyl-ACP methyl ester carboxylesterase